MDQQNAEQAELQQRIAEAGWHIPRDEGTPDGHVVEFQQGANANLHPGAEIRPSRGADRNDAYAAS